MNATKTAASSALVQPEQLLLIDGYTIAKARLSLGGNVELHLSDDDHRTLCAGAKLGAPVSITVQIADVELTILGHLKAHGATVSGREGAVKVLSIKLDSALGADGEPVDDGGGGTQEGGDDE
jgi:hypothetical protein